MQASTENENTYLAETRERRGTPEGVGSENGQVAQVTFDYTLDILFSGGHDPLPMKGSIRMKKVQEGWKVLKDTPKEASYLELYKIAQPHLAGDE